MATRDEALLADKFFKSLPAEQQESIKLSVGDDTAKRAEMVGRLSSMALEKGVTLREGTSVLEKFGKAAKQGVEAVGAVQAAKALPETAAGFVEGATAGLPRMGIEAAFPQIDIPRGNLQGQIAGFALGPGKLIGAAGKAATAGMAGRIAPKVVAGTLEGALGGLTFPQEGLNAEERITGSLIGGGLGMIAGAGVGAFQAFKQSKDARKALQKLAEQEIKFGQTQTAKLPAEIREEAKFLGQQKNKIVQMEKDALSSQVKELGKQLKEEAEKTAEGIKEPVLTFLKSTREELGASFDDALKNAPNAGMSVANVKQLVEEVGVDLAESGVETGKTLIGNVQKLLADKADDAIITNIELQRLKSALNRGTAPGLARGSVTPDDLASISFAKRVTGFLKDTVPRFRETSQSYADFSDLAKFAYKRLAPKASEYEVGKGASILAKAGSGKLDIGEQKALAALEKGTGIQFTKGVKNIGSKMQELRSLSAEKIAKVEADFAKRLSDYDSKIKLASQANEARASRLASEKLALQGLIQELAPILKIAGFVVRASAGAGIALGVGGTLAKAFRP